MTPTARLHRISLGVSNCYLLHGEGAVLVDAGPPGRESAIEKAFARLGVPLDALKLIVLTHGHFDHMGSASKLKARTGAKIAMHARDRSYLERGVGHVSPGVTRWGRVFGRVARTMMPFVRVPVAEVDVELNDEELSLAQYAIAARVIHTPGHTLGSLSVLTDDGDAMVGDLAMNGLPARVGAGLPSMAEDLGKARESWHRLLAMGTRVVHPGHGAAFSSEVMRRAVQPA